MRIYAERPARAALQVLADVAVLAWVWLVFDVARAARDALLALQVPAARLTRAGESIGGAFTDAASTAAGVPFVGDDLSRALGGGTAAGESLATSGRDLAGTALLAGYGVASATVLVGVVPVVVLWLALRALARVPTRRLLQIAPDPAAAWRRGDPAVLGGLAALELAALGLHPRDRHAAGADDDLSR